VDQPHSFPFLPHSLAALEPCLKIHTHTYSGDNQLSKNSDSLVGRERWEDTIGCLTEQRLPLAGVGAGKGRGSGTGTFLDVLVGVLRTL
jgi:hypothetical protein